MSSATEMNAPLPWTGERYVPEIGGPIELEHLHRYMLAASLVRGKRVLDIASGEGYGSDLLALSARSVFGVDISEEAVAHAGSRYRRPNLEYRVGSAADIPIADASVDAVVSFETIEHHDQHEKMLAEIKRVLAPGGLLVMSSPNRHYYSVVPNYSNPYHVKELFTEELDRLAQELLPKRPYSGPESRLRFAGGSPGRKRFLLQKPHQDRRGGGAFEATV